MISEIKKFFNRFLNNLKLRNKLMLSYFILIIIPLGVLTFVSLNQVSKTIQGQVLFSAKQNFEQTNSFLDYKISKIINLSDIITIDKNLTTILAKDPDNYDVSEQIHDAQDLTTLYLTPYQTGDDVYRLRLYVTDSLIYSHEQINLFSLKDAESTEWYRLLTTNRDKILWCPPQYFYNSEDNGKNTVISAARVIRDPNLYNKIIGVFRIDMLESDIQNIIKKANITKNSIAYLQNAKGEIVTSSNYNMTTAVKVDPDFCITLSKRENKWSEIALKGKRLLIGSTSVQGTDWILVSVTPYEDILSSSDKIKNQMLILLLVLFTFAYALAYYISGSSTKRISQLIKWMRKAQKGELEEISSYPAKDEVGELVENFNFMIHKMKILIEDQYRTGQEVKNAELKAFQAQINPHFLYNTLDLINWSAIKNKIPEISTIVQSLAKFYKLSLSKGKDIVSIADEIMHATLYINIQNMRFSNKIALKLDIDEKLYSYSILKIILQPIVENSILHGILESESKTGTITISGRLEDETVILSVMDDGIGISEEKLNTLLVESATNESHGYGIRNINNRIKLYYGEKYGLKYKSQLEKGTEVEISIPAYKYSI